MRILLVDGDIAPSRALLGGLQPEGFHVEHTDSGEDALSLLRHFEFDLVLVNLSLPDMEGVRLISCMRNAKRETPLLALTQSSSTEIRLRALTAGADDVVHRQTDLSEMVARINAIIRRSRGYGQSTMHIGPVCLNAVAGTASVNGTSVALTQREFTLLKTLMLRKNMVMTKEALMNAIYGGIDEPEPKIIDVFICKIRTKFAKVGCDDVIGTVWGRGYVVRDNTKDREATQPRTLEPQEHSSRPAHA